MLRNRVGGVVVSLASFLAFGVVLAAPRHLEPPADGRSPDGVWSLLETLPRLAVEPEPWVQPEVFQPATIDAARLEALLQNVPVEYTDAARTAPTLFFLPTPDGTFSRFEIVEAPIMEPPLAAKFPEIKTYRGQGVDDPAATVRLDWTPKGFHAQVLTPHGSFYIDPYWRDDTTHYAVYYRRTHRPPDAFQCLVPGNDESATAFGEATAMTTGPTLRTYRLAVAATGEYTTFHGGTVVAGMAAITTAVNRVVGVYETELAIRMVLVANNNLLVYTNGGTDPYTNNNGVAMLSQNQSTCNAVIGSANYDIGHVFSTGGGGVAGLAVVCRTSKAQGVTGLPQPTGDDFYIDYVAHEMGHQFGGNHSFNGITANCGGGNRNGSTAYEPGSGSTIMAYAGICGADDLQPHSDAYFSFISIQEIVAYTNSGQGNTCAVQSATGNNAPTVEAGINYAIPRGTTFALTALGDDVDGDPLTYCWEQRDLGPGITLATADNGTSPLVRSFLATTSPTRIFPRLSNILNGVNTNDEKLPNLARTMKFRVTVRDNRSGGGGVNADDMQLTVVGGVSPFTITQPSAGVTWSATRQVVWVVGSTTSAPISTSQVNILLSTDGGQTFPTVLAAATPNDGSEFVVLPSINSSTARIKVEPVGNVYFAMSRGFNIVPCQGTSPPGAEPSPVAKNRYISFVPAPVGLSSAIRVTLTDLPAPYSAFNGQARWVGPPTSYGSGASQFWAAPLQCTPVYLNWTTIPLVHVYGAEVIPDAEYDVQSVQCDPFVENDFSTPLVVVTGKWGDVTSPFAPSANQPNFQDVTAVVGAFQGAPNGVSKPQAQLQPNSVVPGNPVNFQDVSACVAAVQGQPYSYVGPSNCP